MLSDIPNDLSVQIEQQSKSVVITIKIGSGNTVVRVIDKTLTTAVVDRLLHHSSVIEIKGESYRFKRRD